MLTPTDIFGLGTWQPYQCSYDTPPPLSVVALDGGSQMGRHFRHDVVKPDTTFRKQYAITGPQEVQGGKGMICTDGMCYAKYGDSSVAKGDTVGPKPDSWVLWKNYPGFRVIEVTDAANKIMLAVPEPVTKLRVKVATKVAYNGTATAKLCVGDSDTVTTIDIGIKNTGADLFTDEIVDAFLRGSVWTVEYVAKAIDGTLAGSLSQGSSVTLNVDPGSDTVTVQDRFMKSGATAIASGKKAGAIWEHLRKEWTVYVVECA